MESIFELKCVNLFLIIFPGISLHCKLVPVFQSSNMAYSYNSYNSLDARHLILIIFKWIMKKNPIAVYWYP